VGGYIHGTRARIYIENIMKYWRILRILAKTINPGLRGVIYGGRALDYRIISIKGTLRFPVSES
jgi:hypothetical protein